LNKIKINDQFEKGAQIKKINQGFQGYDCKNLEVLGSIEGACVTIKITRTNLKFIKFEFLNPNF